MVKRLMASPDFAYHQRNELDVLLLARKKNDGKWRNYLLQATKENRSWDRMFREIMLGQEGRKPEEDAALEFLKVRAKELDDMTNDTSRLFFGVSINCAKCHDHPLVDDWKQDHYFGFTSFFNRTYLNKQKLLVERPKGAVKFKTTAGEEKQAHIMFLTGTVIEEPVLVKTKQDPKKEDNKDQKPSQDEKTSSSKTLQFSPRAKLVEVALQDSDYRFFAKSIVNRIWVRLLGRGLVAPLDQMHSENPASHPELLDWLAQDLVGHQYNLKRLIQGIVLSETYARSSRWEQDGERPAGEYFAVAVPRPLSPRQYSLSLLIATANPETFPLDMKPQEWSKRREQLENATNGWFDDFEIPGESFQISVNEALLISNSERMEKDLLRDSNDRLVGYLKGIEDQHTLIEKAFQVVLSRKPEPEELEAFQVYLSKRDDRPLKGIQQIVWALISSPELRFNY
ncbi:MAG: DUF1553 domain-containing protein [Planctomycetes bacterium]|nr:DUF1553 domain-containing protein [Planctomycetota bacterium]